MQPDPMTMMIDQALRVLFMEGLEELVFCAVAFPFAYLLLALRDK